MPALRISSITTSTPAQKEREPMQLQEAARLMVASALAYAEEKATPSLRARGLRVEAADPHFRDHLKWGLTLSMTKHLADHDVEVRAVYAFEPSANADAEDAETLPPDDMLHLLVLVNRRTAALEALIASLDGALVEVLNECGVPRVPPRLLDVNLITPEDVRLGIGLAGILSAVFAPPIKVWGREA